MGDDPLLLFASELRRLRQQAGLSQDELARRAGMDPSEIRRLESARRDPGVRVIARLASGLGVTPAALLARIG